jgi:hypothetical protein
MPIVRIGNYSPYMCFVLGAYQSINRLSMMGGRFGRLCSVHTPTLALVIPDMFRGWTQTFTRISGMPDEIVILCGNREVSLDKLTNGMAFSRGRCCVH